MMVGCVGWARQGSLSEGQESTFGSTVQISIRIPNRTNDHDQNTHDDRTFPEDETAGSQDPCVGPADHEGEALGLVIDWETGDWSLPEADADGVVGHGGDTEAVDGVDGWAIVGAVSETEGVAWVDDGSWVSE